MPANQSAKPAASQVASRNPSAPPSELSRPSLPSVPSVPPIPSSGRPVLPVALLIAVLLIFFGGLFVYRFVLKKTLLTSIVKPLPVPTAESTPEAGSIVKSSGQTGGQVLVGKIEKIDLEKDESRFVVAEESSGKKFTFVIGSDVFTFKRTSPGEKLTVESRINVSDFGVGDKVEVVTGEEIQDSAEIKKVTKFGLI